MAAFSSAGRLECGGIRDASIPVAAGRDIARVRGAAELTVLGAGPTMIVTVIGTIAAVRDDAAGASASILGRLEASRGSLFDAGPGRELADLARAAAAHLVVAIDDAAAAVAPLS